MQHTNINKIIYVLKNHFLDNEANKQKDYEANEIIDKAYTYYMGSVTNIISGNNKDASFMQKIKSLANLIINTL